MTKGIVHDDVCHHVQSPFRVFFTMNELRAAVMAAPTMNDERPTINDALYNNVFTASAIFLAMYGLFMV